jgi:hypothetical protein
MFIIFSIFLGYSNTSFEQSISDDTGKENNDCVTPDLKNEVAVEENNHDTSDDKDEARLEDDDCVKDKVK